MDKVEDLERFEELVVSMRDEYIEKEGHVTVEFSTSPNHLLDKIDILSNHNVNTEEFAGYWFMFPCDTCKGYNEETPIHVMMIDIKASKDFRVGGDLYRAQQTIEALNQELSLYKEKLNSGLLVNPDDLLKVVSIALEHQKELPVSQKDNALLFLSNYVDDHYQKQDDENPLVADTDIQAKQKELKRLDDLIAQRKRELGILENSFSKAVPVAVEKVKKLAVDNSSHVSDFIPDEILVHKFLASL
ncbi:hypothetical protein KW882_02440 [Vibrio parahaemolyticus]